MSHKFVFPDINDRSVNSPKILINQPQVLGLYNQANPSNKETQVNMDVKRWFINQAKLYKWDTIEFLGSQCVLGAIIERN